MSKNILAGAGGPMARARLARGKAGRRRRREPQKPPASATTISADFADASRSLHIGWFRLVAVSGWTAALMYAVSTALGSVLVPGYSQVSDSVSELTSSDAPRRLFFAAAYGCYNAAVGALGLGLFRSSRPTRTTRLAAGLFTMVAVAGLAMVSVFPQDPMGTAITVRGVGHIVTAGVAAFGLVAAAFLWGSAWRSDPRWMAMARWSRCAGLAILITGASGVVALAAGGTVFGLTERLTQLCFLSWFAALGTYAWRSSAANRRPDDVTI